MTHDALVAAGCEFQVVEAPLEEPFLGYYRASARMWNQLRREFLYAAEQVGRCRSWLHESDACCAQAVVRRVLCMQSQPSLWCLILPGLESGKQIVAVTAEFPISRSCC